MIHQRVCGARWRNARNAPLRKRHSRIRSGAATHGSRRQAARADQQAAQPDCSRLRPHQRLGRWREIVGLTNSLAVELGEFGIRVNSVHTCGTNTPMGNHVSFAVFPSLSMSQQEIGASVGSTSTVTRPFPIAGWPSRRAPRAAMFADDVWASLYVEVASRDVA
jgi:hypothetical protein